MSFLAICLSPTFLLAGNVAVKSCLAVIQLMSCLQTVQMKMFHNSTLVLHILSVGLLFTYRFSLQKICGRLIEQMHLLCLIWQLHSSKELCPKSKTQCESLYSGDETHYGSTVNTLKKVALRKMCISDFCFFPLFSLFMWCPAPSPDWILRSTGK